MTPGERQKNIAIAGLIVYDTALCCSAVALPQQGEGLGVVAGERGIREIRAPEVQLAGAGKLVPFQLFMATLPFRAVVTVAIRDVAQIRRIKLERH